MHVIFTNAFSHRRPIPQIILQFTPSNLQALVPSVRAHLLPPLPRCRPPGSRAPFEHELQALRSVYRRASVGEWEGLLGSIG